ncbi:MAG: type II secretion system protein N [Pseudomonadota bacterium]
MSVTARHGVWLGNLLVLGFLVWSGVSLSMTVLESRLETQTNIRQPISIETGPSPKLKSLNQYEAIARYNIFGGRKEERAPKTEGAPAVAVTASMGDVVLRGTIVDHETGYTAAVLEDVKSKEQQLYRPGAKLGSAELVRIETDHVILRQGEREIKLLMQQDEVKPLPFSRTSQPSPAPVKNTKSKMDQDDTLVQPVGPNEYLVSRDELTKKLGDLSSFMRDIMLRPYFKSGEPHGFQLARISPGSPFFELGLRPMDVILKVNDVLVSNAEDVINLYRQVQQLEWISIGLERQGQPLTMSYQLR